MEEEREHFSAKLTAMQSEIRAISESAAQDLKPVMLDQTSVGRVSRIDAISFSRCPKRPRADANNSWPKLRGPYAASNQGALACAFYARWRSTFAG